MKRGAGKCCSILSSRKSEQNTIKGSIGATVHSTLPADNPFTHCEPNRVFDDRNREANKQSAAALRQGPVSINERNRLQGI